MTADMSTLQHYLSDLVFLLRERAKEANDEANEKGSDFQSGRALAFVEVLSSMQNQCLAFGISPEMLGLDEFDPLEYLSPKDSAE